VTQLENDRRDAGDVGRRIAERQDELALTTAQVADRAGMTTVYLEYLEHTPTAEPSSSALLRIAHDRSSGRADAASDPHLVAIDEEECHELLAGGGVGRVVFRSAGRPVALPVNFKTLAGDIIFRSADDGEVSAITCDEPVSFEVDRIDDAMREGWSVLVTGTVYPVRADDQVHEVQALGIEPWAGGERQTYFCLSVSRLTGKRINAVR